jgi:hypothetical protein
MMKLFFFFLVISILFFDETAITQHAYHLSNKNDPGFGCIITKKYTSKQRLRLYPFSKAVKILAISYPYDPRPGDDTLTGYKFNGLGSSVVGGVLDHRGLIEVKTLTPSQINYLTDFMDNLNTKSGKIFYDAPYTCFGPRNALIFLDHNGKVFDYVQVCFECNRVEGKFDKIYFKKDCSQFMDLFKQFFIDIGIQYGTLKR